VPDGDVVSRHMQLPAQGMSHLHCASLVALGGMAMVTSCSISHWASLVMASVATKTTLLRAGRLRAYPARIPSPKATGTLGGLAQEVVGALVRVEMGVSQHRPSDGEGGKVIWLWMFSGGRLGETRVHRRLVGDG
jgi:hypothetical protein